MIEYRLIPEASQDYQEAMEWYQNRSEQAANGFSMAVEFAWSTFAAHPVSGPIMMTGTVFTYSAAIHST